MVVGFCQLDVTYKDIDANLEKIEKMLGAIAADLIVLPELCLTGYSFSVKSELTRLATPARQEQIINRLTGITKKTKATIVAGIAEQAAEKLYNTALVVGPAGILGRHRKINLTKNEQIFDPGDDCSLFSVNGIKVGVAICFESWFPESFRILTLKGAQLICCPANFGGPWTPNVLRVRSLENSVYTILANRTGSEILNNEKIHFRGESQITDSGGNVLLQAGAEECVQCLEVKIEAHEPNKNIICDDLALERSRYNKFVKYSF